MWPCKRPAKKARTDRRDGWRPPVSPVILSVRIWISGKDASFEGLNPSDVLALHRTLMDLWNRCGTKEDTLGPCYTSSRNEKYVHK